MIYACDSPMCHYLFSADDSPERCPDCGHDKIRLGTDQEQAEYEACRREAADAQVN